MGRRQLYWRKIQQVDEGWQLELDDPMFKASTIDPECHDEIDGRRPLAHLWVWSYTDKPWRACIEGVPYSHRDYTTRKRAMDWTEKRACKLLDNPTI